MRIHPQSPNLGDLPLTASGYEPFMQAYAGVTFNDGIYRVHTLANRLRWTRLIEEAFPQHRGRISAFGCAWSGCQFALDAKRRQGTEPLVLLFEPSTGRVFQVPATFEQFHEDILINETDAALCPDFFEKWLAVGNRAPGPTECIGYKVPLFFNGADEIHNLELTDMEVYWDMAAMLLTTARALPKGTPIGKVSIE